MPSKSSKPWNASTSAPQTIEAFLATFDHAAKQEIIALRHVFLEADASIAEGIKWNAPSFRTTEYFATFNRRAKEGVQLILLFGAKKNDIASTGIAIPDPDGLLKWLAKDRATITFRDLNDIAAKKSAFARLIQQWIKYVLKFGCERFSASFCCEEIMKIAQVQSYALSLPQTTEEPHFHYSSFRVKGKIFATVSPEETHIHVFVSDDERERALTLYPEFVEKLSWGGMVVGVRVTLAKAKPDVVKQLVRQAWLRKAPKRLATSLLTALD